MEVKINREIRQYIENNPGRWLEDEYAPKPE